MLVLAVNTRRSIVTDRRRRREGWPHRLSTLARCALRPAETRVQTGCSGARGRRGPGVNCCREVDQAAACAADHRTDTLECDAGVDADLEAGRVTVRMAIAAIATTVDVAVTAVRHAR